MTDTPIRPRDFDELLPLSEKSLNSRAVLLKKVQHEVESFYASVRNPDGSPNASYYLTWQFRVFEDYLRMAMELEALAIKPEVKL